ncbi:MAG TPA: MlaD family protein [Steroidobacteraceae bacterium]|nr:MlaD family protein [Steroidobacteraceae bacterium]
MAPAKPAIVGGFVLGAVLLGVVATLVFGGTRWLSHTEHVVVVFTDSLSGLTAGSPVTFRGVTIGRVASIKVRVNAPAIAPVIQVYLDLEPDKISWTSGPSTNVRADLQSAVIAGLRAQLSSQSLVTGELSVDLDFHPRAPVVLVDSSEEPLHIPTIASDLQQFKDQVRDMNLPDIAIQTRQVLGALQHLAATLEPEIAPVSHSLQATMAATTATAERIASLSAESQRQVTINGDELSEFLKTAQQASAHVDALAVSLDELTSPRGAVRTDLDGTLRDLAASSSSLRLFTHDLERNPLGTLMRKPSQ